VYNLGVIKVFHDVEQLSAAAADYVARLSKEAVADRGVFRIALAGGSTPKKLYELLSSDKYKGQIDWSKWQVFFSDERFVSLDDERSNYNLAQTSLLSKVPIPASQVHAIDPQAGSVEAAAEAYEDAIKAILSENQSFDLILLGLGSDGHTASLFPGNPALQETEKLVVASSPGVLPPPVDRVTFTFPLINAARNVAFLTAGADKAAMVKQAAQGGDIPAANVKPSSGEATWFIDQTAARNL
jgi:6-phosphogluconolactonase